MFRPEPSFAELLESLFEEAGWENPYQAAMHTGIHYSTLHNILAWPEDRKGKRYSLTHDDINALLLGASACDLSDRRYEYWYEVLHKHVIAKHMALALLYSTRRPDPLDQKYNEEHNQAIHNSLKKDYNWFESAIDYAFRAGAKTWGAVPIAALAEECVRQGGPVIVYVSDDWTLRLIDRAKEALALMIKYTAVPGLAVLAKVIGGLDDRIVEGSQYMWGVIKQALRWLRDLLRE